MDGLYRLNDISFANSNAIVGSFAYFCLHINKNKMKRMINVGLIPNMNIVFPTCEPCISSKMVRLPFPKGQRSNELLAIVHFDVCGPLNIKTHGVCYILSHS